MSVICAVIALAQTKGRRSFQVTLIMLSMAFLAGCSTNSGLAVATPTKDLFSDVQQIVLLKRGEPQKNRIVISDPERVRQMVDLLALDKSDRLVCDMAWRVTFVKKTGKVDTNVCKRCIEIRNDRGGERFKTPPAFYKLVQQSEK